MRIEPDIYTDVYIGFRSLHIPRKHNTRKYLYNEMLDLTNELKIPANFDNEGITFPRITFKLLDRLKEMGLKWVDKK
jgi:hypothetical protein